MYCETCGAKRIEGATFCVQCGARLSPPLIETTASDARPPAAKGSPFPAPDVTSTSAPQAGASFPPGYGPPPGWDAKLESSARFDAVLNQPLAPWWKRLVAMILDVAILCVGYFIILAVIGALLGNSQSGTSAGSQTTNSGQVLAGLFFLWIIATIPNAVYFGFLNGSSRGQTVGKIAMGIAVRDARTGERIGFWRAASRTLISGVFELLFFVPFVLDSLAPLWDKRRQAWHDRATHSVVIDLKP
ncbi:MAG TPA: RDD family protein [Acidimicrobiales bacterium]|nr:RDD family protein [Acidimicrobiales bacterium]